MKLLSIDIETSGLNPNKCCVLEFGAVLFDPQPDLQNTTPDQRRWQTFERLIHHDTICGEPYALRLNSDIFAELSGMKDTHLKKVAPEDLGISLAVWLSGKGITKENKVTIVGKNYDAFDRQFLERLPYWKLSIDPLVERRVLDVGSLCFNPGDGRVENLETCLKKLGITTSVSHRACDDALNVATSVSRFFA